MSRTHTLRSHIIFLYCSLLAAVILCSSFLSSHLFSNILLSYISENIGGMARQAAERIDTYFEDLSETVLMVCSTEELIHSIQSYYDEDGAVQYESYQKLNRFIAESLRANDSINDILILSDGMCLNYNQSSYGRTVRANSAILSQIRQEVEQSPAFHIGFRVVPASAYYYQKSDTMALLLYFPVTAFSSGTEDRIATMVFSIDLERIYALHQPPANYADSASFLLDAQGSQITGAKQPMDYPLDTLSDGVQEVAVGDTQFLAAVSTISASGWRVGYFVSLSFLAAQVRFVHVISATIILVSLLLAIAAAVYIGWRTTQPVMALINGMEQLSQGNFSVRMSNVSRFRELEVLSTGFNDMAEQITELIHEVYDVRLLQNEAELTALHSKLNPHFFYNSLQIIQSLAILGNTEQLQDVVTALGSLFEYILYHDNSTVPLSAEVEHIRNYLEIQRVRFAHPLRFVCQVAPDAADCLIPKLSVQPLIENCIKHGLRQTDPHPCIGLYADCADGILHIRVADNGCGVPAGRLDELRAALASEADSPEHIGLSNIQRRFRLRWGSPYGLAIDSKPHAWTLITLTLPAAREQGDTYENPNPAR